MNINIKKTEFVKPEITVKELSTALYSANQKLEKTNKELLKSKKELNEIYANLSHDLRSPITTIRNYMEYILSLDSPDYEELLATFKLIHGKVDYLEQMINDMFLLSAINSTNKAFQYENVNIGVFLEEFYYSCEEERKYSKRQLCLRVPKYFPYTVFIDCRMITRVLDNLFTNALKYSHEKASITLEAEGIGNNKILISVTDTGVGIAREHLNKIFDRTYMVAAARTPGRFSGCGLGLTIAKSIIESHKGAIWCESILGKGSSFRFTLPANVTKTFG